MTPPDEPIRTTQFWNVPNVLTLSRLPLSALLFACIDQHWWWFALVTFVVAALTDWLDGWWARRFNQLSVFGRVFDPLTDKIMLGGAFIFLVAVPESGMRAWIAAAVISRELLITGVRGYVESLGKKFGADWFGKLKTILQCFWLGTVLFYLGVTGESWAPTIEVAHLILLYAMVIATIGSGLQYCWKAVRMV